MLGEVRSRSSPARDSSAVSESHQPCPTNNIPEVSGDQNPRNYTFVRHGRVAVGLPADFAGSFAESVPHSTYIHTTSRTRPQPPATTHHLNILSLHEPPQNIPAQLSCMRRNKTSLNNRGGEIGPCMQAGTK